LVDNGPSDQEFRPVLDRLQRIQAGDEKENSLLVLDDEYFQNARKLWEVALGELNSAKVLLDDLVDHEATTEEMLAMPDGERCASEAPRFRPSLLTISLWHR
jgi:hypothetical protein